MNFKENFKEVIENNIPDPGHFIVFNDKEDNQNPTNSQENNVFLNILKDTEKAEEVYLVFVASKQNSIDLLNEALLLLEHECYARAIALAIMSYEELGKSQIAADFYSGILPESVYKKAFREHKKTSYASRHCAIGKHEKVKHGYFIDNDVAKILESIRQSALYVDKDNIPFKNFNKDDATLIIDRVIRHHMAIENAEELNGRIGSKALFK